MNPPAFHRGQWCSFHPWHDLLGATAQAHGAGLTAKARNDGDPHGICCSRPKDQSSYHTIILQMYICADEHNIYIYIFIYLFIFIYIYICIFIYLFIPIIIYINKQTNIHVTYGYIFCSRQPNAGRQGWETWWAPQQRRLRGWGFVNDRCAH